jgi:ABC-2 type transport system permease protein
MPAFVFPQLLLCGLFVARERMAAALEVAADFLPLTYAFDPLDRVASSGSLGLHGRLDVAVIAGGSPCWRSSSAR